VGREGLSAEEREAIALALRPFIKPGIKKVEATDDVARAVERIVARRESEAAEKALRKAADAIQPGDHHCFKPWCPQCGMKQQREWTQADLRARADSVAQGREEGGK
jgi:hypothetical protein